MKKEYLIASVLVLFLGSYVLNFLAGTFAVIFKSPLELFSEGILSNYPLTGVEIFMKALGSILAVVLIIEEVEKRPFIRSIVVLILALLAQFYSIQQLATGGTITPVQWTLALFYAGLGLLPFVVYYLVRGILKLMFKGLSGNSDPDIIPSAGTQEESTNNV